MRLRLHEQPTLRLRTRDRRAVARRSDAAATPGSSETAEVRGAQHALARVEQRVEVAVTPDVVPGRHDVGAALEQSRSASLAVRPAPSAAFSPLTMQKSTSSSWRSSGQARLDRAPSGHAEDVGDEEEPHVRVPFRCRSRPAREAGRPRAGSVVSVARYGRDRGRGQAKVCSRPRRAVSPDGPLRAYGRGRLTAAAPRGAHGRRGPAYPPAPGSTSERSIRLPICAGTATVEPTVSAGSGSRFSTRDDEPGASRRLDVDPARRAARRRRFAARSR